MITLVLVLRHRHGFNPLKLFLTLISAADGKEAVSRCCAMFLNVPPACPTEVFHYFKERPIPLTKCRDWLDKEFFQRCEELLQHQLTSKGSFITKSKEGKVYPNN